MKGRTFEQQVVLEIRELSKLLNKQEALLNTILAGLKEIKSEIKSLKADSPNTDYKGGFNN